MNLLITTQALDKNDSNLGFFHRWIEEFAKHCDKVIVICLNEGEHNLPKNVQVLSLGKEKGVSRLARAWRFIKYIRAYKNEYDAVFVHMNPEYIVLGGYLWRKWGKKVSLWYAHKSVTRKLSFAMRFLDYVFTVSENSFRIRTPKICVLGHGIDTELFKPEMRETSIEMRLVTSGRLAQRKHIIEMLGVLDMLYERGEKFTFTIVGSAVTPTEEQYEKQLREEIEKRPYKNKVHLAGAVPHDDMPALLNKQDIFLNFSGTGNMDKAGLEALAVGVPVITTNDAFYELLSPFKLYVGERDYGALADAISRTMRSPEHAAMVATLRNKVVEGHSLSRLVPKIVAILESR